MAALAGIAQAAAQAGDAARASAALAEIDRCASRDDHELGLARAWTAAAIGELSAARALAQEVAIAADARGAHGLAARAWHELTRLGAPEVAAPRLAALTVDGPFVQVAAAHAAALVARDGHALLDVAERFSDLGADLLAAEAASAAAAAHRATGRDASARAAAGRAAVLLERCEGAAPPTLTGGVDAEALTPREREIALLASSPLSSREIAERLVVSVRTVDNHLQRVYRKLGIGRREQLAGLI